MKDRFLKEINKHQGIIHKIVSVYTRDPEDKQDLFQEILLQLWKAYPGFQNRAAFSTWMYRVALNTALLSDRRKKIEKKAGEQMKRELDLHNDQDADERLLHLYAAINQLHSLDKAITLLYLEQKSYEEIALFLSINKNTVGVRISRIKEKLKKLLDDGKS